MDSLEAVEQAKALRDRIQKYARDEHEGSPESAAKAQVIEFLRQTAGPKSAFVQLAAAADGFPRHVVATLRSVLDSYIEYVEAGLASALSPERKAQLDVVSDVLGQAQQILSNKDFHPAAAAVLIGAALEEFLRTWVEGEGLAIGSSKSGIDAYAKALRTGDLISKQDVKDITAWAGTRNHAAHGEWEEVEDRSRISLMLEGVNLFMRQKAGGAGTA